MNWKIKILINSFSRILNNWFLAQIKKIALCLPIYHPLRKFGNYQFHSEWTGAWKCITTEFSSKSQWLRRTQMGVQWWTSDHFSFCTTKVLNRSEYHWKSQVLESFKRLNRFNEVKYRGNLEGHKPLRCDSFPLSICIINQTLKYFKGEQIIIQGESTKSIILNFT